MLSGGALGVSEHAMNPIFRVAGEIVVCIVAGVAVFIVADLLFVVASGDIHIESLMLVAVGLGFAAMVGTGVAWQKWAVKKPPDGQVRS